MWTELHWCHMDTWLRSGLIQIDSGSWFAPLHKLQKGANHCKEIWFWSGSITISSTRRQTGIVHTSVCIFLCISYTPNQCSYILEIQELCLQLQPARKKKKKNSCSLSCSRLPCIVALLWSHLVHRNSCITCVQTSATNVNLHTFWAGHIHEHTACLNFFSYIKHSVQTSFFISLYSIHFLKPFFFL